MKKFFVFFAFCATILILVVSVIGCNKDNDSASTQSEDSEIKPPVSTFRSANKMIQGLYQSDKVHIFDAVVMVAEEDVTDMSIDTTNKHFSLTFKNEAPKIQRGNVVYIDVQGVPTIVLVLNAETNGKTIDMYGALGDLSYIFHDTELIFETYDFDSISGSNVFAPIKSAVSPSKSSLLFSDDYTWSEDPTRKHVFDIKEPINGNVAFLDDNKIIFSIDKLKYDNICELTFTSSMSEIFENLNLKYSTGRGENQSLDDNFKKVAFECAKEKIYKHTHVIDAQYSVQFILNMCKADALSEKEKKKGPEVLYTTPDETGRFLFPIIGPVHFGFDVLFDPDVNLSLDLSYTHSQRIYGSYIQTTKYIRNKSNEYDEIEEEPINGIKADTPNIPQELFDKSENAFGGDVKGDAKFNFPCIFHVSWLDKRALGVGIALIPYLDVALGGYLGTRNYYGDVKSFYGLFEIGIDWKAALYRTTLIGKEVQFPISIGDWKFDFNGNITKGTLMKFPYKLRTTIKTSSGNKITDSESTLIKFEVGKPLKVKYETLTKFIGGSKGSVFAGNWIYISDKNGVISTPEFSTSKEVAWTPKSKDDFLMATIFGERGEVVYSSTIKYDYSNDDNTEIIPSDEPDDPNDNPTPEVKKPLVHFHLSDRGYQPQGGATEPREQGADGYFWATATPSNSTIVVTVNGKQWSSSKVYYKDLDVMKNEIEVTATNNGVEGSEILYIEITPKEEPAPQITSVKLNGVKVSNGGSITVKKGEQCKVEVLTNTSCEKISGSIGSTSSYVNNQSSFTDSFSCSERGQYKVTATNGNKTATFTFEVVAEDNSPAPQITSVKVNGSTVSNGKTKYFDYGEEVQIEVKTDIVCDEISVDFPDYNTKSANGKDAYKTPWFDATESGTVTITATKNGKTAQFVFYIDVEEKPVVVKAPEITSADITSSSIRVGDGVYIDFETSEKCDVNVYIDGSLKEEFNRTSGDRYKLPTDKAKQYTVKLVAKSLQDPSKTNSVTKRYTVEERKYTIVDAGGLPNNGAQTAAHNYWLCNDLVFQSADKANFEGSFWVYSNGQDEYNTLYVSKKSGTFSSKEIRLIVSTSITDLRDSNIIDQKKFQGGEKEYSIDIKPTSKQLYLIVYVGGGDCGSMAIDGYYCGPFYYESAE